VLIGIQRSATFPPIDVDYTNIVGEAIMDLQLKDELNAFVEELEALGYTWLNRFGTLRTKANRGPRARSVFCPITALYYAKTQKRRPVYSADICGEKLGLSCEAIVTIMYVADIVGSVLVERSAPPCQYLNQRFLQLLYGATHE
jgi:hypothetical protein